LFTVINTQTGQPVIIENKDDNKNKNKCVLLSDWISFGYAGHGKIDGIRTDLWLTEVLHSATECKSLSCFFNKIKDKATNYFSNIFIHPKYKGHAFVGVGWAKYSKAKSLNPILVTISNFHNEEGKQLDEAIDNFNIIVSGQFLRRGKHHFSAIGQKPETKYEKQFFYYINRLLRHCSRKSLAPIILGLLVIAIRKLVSMREESGRYNTIGKNLLGVCLPKTSVTREHLSGIPGSKLVLFGPPRNDIPTFYSFPFDSNEKVQNYGPITVFSPGGVIIGNPQITEFSEIENRKEAVKIWDVCDAVILTEIIGSGTWTDKRRPRISEDYSLTGYSAYGEISGPMWPGGEPSPFYGYLYGINAGSNIIDQIEEDPRYVIVIRERSLINKIPDNDWMLKLENWFIARGMSMDEFLKLRAMIDGFNRMDFLYKLAMFLTINKKK
jgi:hypothetical protein